MHIFKPAQSFWIALTFELLNDPKFSVKFSQWNRNVEFLLLVSIAYHSVPTEDVLRLKFNSKDKHLNETTFFVCLFGGAVIGVILSCVHRDSTNHEAEFFLLSREWGAHTQPGKALHYACCHLTFMSTKQCEARLSSVLTTPTYSLPSLFQMSSLCII